VVAAESGLATGGEGGGHRSLALAHRCDVGQGVLWGGELSLTVHPGLQQAPIPARRAGQEGSGVVLGRAPGKGAPAA
jgi:hypothetical protein